MRNVVDFRKWKRARQTQDKTRRAQPHWRSMVSIGVVSAELVRRLTEDD
jgi:ribosomal protein L32E